MSPRRKEGEPVQRLWRFFSKFRPPLICCSLGAVLFSAASLVAAGTTLGSCLPVVILYGIYVGAAIFLSLAIWAVVLAVQKLTPADALLKAVHQTSFTARLWDDYTYRTVSFTYLSLLLNLFFAIFKAAAGWYFTSAWLVTLSVYYMILCILKFQIIRTHRRLQKEENAQKCISSEWRIYRLCGILFVILTITLQGMVVLIVKDGNRFTYHGMLIFVVAIYDFYCLISSIVYMIKMRKKHSPTVVAIKSISFATSLVSMLSLQTAMFASFGNSMEANKQMTMNILTGSGVCIMLIALGVIMIVQANGRLGVVQHCG